MMERVAEVSPWLGATITGVIYSLYFLIAVSAEVFVGWTRLVVFTWSVAVPHCSMTV